MANTHASTATASHPPGYTVTLPPNYVESSPSPNYTATASAQEVCLGQSTRIHSRHDRTTRSIVREYESKGLSFSVTFRAQRDDVGMVPTYRQEQVIDGFVILNGRGSSAVASLSVKLEGVLEMSADVMGNSQQTFLGATFEIWKQEGDSPAPSTIEFALPLPATIRDVDGQMRPLPSSIKTPSISGLYAAVLYTIKVIVCVKGFGGVFKKNHSLVTPIKFEQQSHPPLPSLATDQSLLSTLKTAPEVWGNVTLDVPLRDTSDVVQCTLAFPASRIFYVKHPIPIHIQLSGPSNALRQFLPPSLAELGSSSSQPSDGNKAPVHVEISLQRRITVDMLGDLVYRTQRLSAPAQLELVHSDLNAGWLGWNGELSISLPEWWAPEPLRVGGFNVMDYIAVSVSAPGNSSASTDRTKGTVLPRSQLFSIKLVTDPFPSL